MPKSLTCKLLPSNNPKHSVLQQVVIIWYIYIPSAWYNQISVFVTTRIYNIIVLHILHWYYITSIPVTMKIIVIKMCMMHITLAVNVCTSISWHLLAVHFAYRALCVQRGRQREGGSEGGRKTERGRERYSNAQLYILTPCMHVFRSDSVCCTRRAL